MKKISIPKKTRNNKLSDKKIKSFLGTKAIVFMLTFGLIGIYLLTRSSAATNPITVWRWCPRWNTNLHLNGCEMYWSPQIIEDTTNLIYRHNGLVLNIKSPRDMVNTGIHYGNHDALWYLVQHDSNPKIYYPIIEQIKREGAGQLPPGWPNGYPGAYVMDNIRYEIEQELKWSWDRPRIIVTGFDTGLNGLSSQVGGSGCGISTTINGPDPDNNRALKLSFVWGEHCRKNKGWNEDRLGVAAAHELGHTLAGLPHLTDSNNLMNANSSCPVLTCAISPDHRAALINYNPNLVYPRTK